MLVATVAKEFCEERGANARKQALSGAEEEPTIFRLAFPEEYDTGGGVGACGWFGLWWVGGRKEVGWEKLLESLTP